MAWWRRVSRKKARIVGGGGTDGVGEMTCGPARMDSSIVMLGANDDPQR